MKIYVLTIEVHSGRCCEGDCQQDVRVVGVYSTMDQAKSAIQDKRSWGGLTYNIRDYYAYIEERQVDSAYAHTDILYSSGPPAKILENQ